MKTKRLSLILLKICKTMSIILAKRYAKALFDSAKENDSIDRAYQDLVDIAKMINASDDFRQFLQNPVLSIEERQKILKNIFGEKYSSITKKFFLFLAAKKLGFTDRAIGRLLKKLINNEDVQNIKNLPTTTLGATETHNIDESLNALVGKIGIETQREQSAFEHQQALYGELENYRQSVSGVSLEEEAVNMIQDQTVFNASAKAMKVRDELFNTILSIKQ